MNRRCRVCGCSDLSSCEGCCWWVADDLCSACAAVERIADDNGDELERGRPDFPGQFAAVADPAGR